MVVVTAIDAAFRPGLKALANSIMANSPGVELHAYTFGEVEPVAGARMIPAPVWDVHYPVSDHWPESSKPSMFRLYLPRLYDERIVWLDADCVVVDHPHYEGGNTWAIRHTYNGYIARSSPVSRIPSLNLNVYALRGGDAARYNAPTSDARRHSHWGFPAVARYSAIHRVITPPD